MSREAKLLSCLAHVDDVRAARLIGRRHGNGREPRNADGLFFLRNTRPFSPARAYIGYKGVTLFRAVPYPPSGWT